MSTSPIRLALILLLATSASGQYTGDAARVVQIIPVPGNPFVESLMVERIYQPKGLNYRRSETVPKGVYQVGDLFDGGTTPSSDLYMVVSKTDLMNGRFDVKLSRVVKWMKGKALIKGLNYVVSVTIAAADASRFNVRDIVQRQQVPGGDKLNTLGQGRLIIKGQPMVETDENYLGDIRYLTVPKSNQSQAAFTGTDVTAIKQLEDPLRRQIYLAMNANPQRDFTFPARADAVDNVNIRVGVINFMNRIESQSVNFDYYARADPIRFSKFYANPDLWFILKNNQGAAGLVFESAKGKTAYDAIMGVTKTPFRGECLSALEMTIFYSTATVIGRDRFNKVYPDGLHLLGLPGIDPSISIYRNVETQFDGITAAAMVPGDWVYMRNKADYRTFVPDGFFSGENALYMGRYFTTGGPRYDSNAPRRFSGMGLYDKTEAELRGDLMQGYRDDTREVAQNLNKPWSAAKEADIIWALQGTVTSGDVKP